MRSLETSRVMFTSDVLEATVERVEGLPQRRRGKPAVVSMELGGCELCTAKAVLSRDQGAAECAAASVPCHNRWT
jgi:hypothetical protein